MAQPYVKRLVTEEKLFKASGLDPKSYGAVGNGSTNDQAAIDAAVTAALAFGTDLYLSDGVYKVNSIIVDGAVKFNIVGTGELRGANDSLPVLKIVNCQNMTVDNIPISHLNHSARTYDGSGIEIADSSYITITNCEIYQVSSAGIYIDNSRFITIHGNTVDYNLADGIHTTNGSSDVSIFGNHVDHPGDDSIAVVSYQSNAGICNRISIFGNTIRNEGDHGRGITVVGGKHISILGNTISRMDGYGIAVVQEVSYATKEIEDVVIANNVIHEAGWSDDVGFEPASIFVDGEDGDYSIKDVIITGNLIKDAKFDSIHVGANDEGDVSNIKIHNNIIDKSHGFGGIIVGGTVYDCVVSDNIVKEVDGHGIWVWISAGRVIIDNNTVIKPNQGNDTGIFGIVNHTSIGYLGHNLVYSDLSKETLQTEIYANSMSNWYVFGPIEPGGTNTAGRPEPGAHGHGIMFDYTVQKPIWAFGPAWHEATEIIRGSLTVNVASIAAGGVASIDVPVAGAVADDFVVVGPPGALEDGLIYSARVPSVDIVRIRIHNITGSAIDPANATWKAAVLR